MANVPTRLLNCPGALVVVGVFVTAMLLAGCRAGAPPTAPTASVTPVPTGPRVLLAGQSGAFFLAPHMPDALADTNIDGNIDYWLQSQSFAALARTPQVVAFVWYQGSGDAGRLSTDDYAAKLRQIIALVRTSHPDLPVRIIEIVDFPIRAAIREAQRQVAADPNVLMIPTADLPLDPTGHYFPAGYQEIRERIYRSLGR